MHSIFDVFRAGGLPNVLILLFGLIGGFVAIGTIAAVATRSRRARVFGGVALVLASITLAAGALGVMYDHGIADAAADSAQHSGLASGANVGRLRREGYAESRACAEFALGCALLPLLAGTLAFFAGRTRTTGDPAPSMIVPALLLGVAGVLVLGNAALLAQKLPGGDLDPAGPTLLVDRPK